jgi:hypothetical protein
MRKYSIYCFLAGGLALLGSAAIAAPKPPNSPLATPAAAGCSICHTKYVQSMKDNGLLASKHAKAGLDGCESCHDQESLKKPHEQATTPPVVIRARRYSQDFCLKCHGSLEELAKKTANSKVLTDDQGKTINPHDLPKTPAHMKAGDCANCHRMHKKPMEPNEFCYGCHHKKVYACKECHADKK